MFNDAYKQKIMNQKPSAELLARTKQEIVANMESKKKRPRFRRMIAATAAAAVFVVAVFGLMSWNPQTRNAFAIAMLEIEVDDEVPVAINLSDLIGTDAENMIIPMIPHGINDTNRPVSIWEHWLVFPVNLEFTGTNIDSVLYSVENGSFIDGSHTGPYISLLGREVHTGAMGSDFPLQFAVPYLNPPSEVIFTAVATFHDGSREERVMILDIEQVIALSGITLEEMPHAAPPQTGDADGYTIAQIQVALQMQFLRGDWGESWPQVISAERVARDRDYVRLEGLGPDAPPIDLTNSVRYRVEVRFRQSPEAFTAWEELYRDWEANPFRRDGEYTILASYYYFHDVNGKPVQTFVGS